MDKARILIVDDTPSNLEVLTDLLAPEYHVSVATNGLDAIRLASSDAPPDLILLDIMMPDINGYQVCEALKRQKKTSGIPIIFVTAISEFQSEQKGLDLGAVDYITKPFNPHIVLARVKTHISLYSQTKLLNGLVKERTIELQKARDEAEAANLAKSVFLSNISHELRTPLNGIMGMTQLLLEANPSEDQRNFLEDAWRSASRLLIVVNDLLDLSATESGELEFSPTLMEIRDALTPVLSHYEERSQKKGVDFRSTFGTDVPEKIKMDGARVRQVLINLLSNAIRFTRSGTIDVTVNALKGAGPDDCQSLLFTVKDTGIGIPADKLDLIFEPFIIGEEFLTKEHAGAGLGLAIAKRLVSLMGGHIWLEESFPGNTIFHFTVPCE